MNQEGEGSLYQEDNIKFFMKCRPGVTYLNIIVIFMIRFSNFMIDVFILVLLPLTLKDQYKVDKNLATVNSNVHLATHVFGFI